ncbi:MAG TPA: hypothetical protein PLS55_12450 [Thermogutta sp.]|nr:hypothetical protein [Thermogutta sp.]
MTPIKTPRLAIGTIDEETDPWSFLRIFLQELTSQGLHVQTFLSQASFFGFQNLKRWSGATPRRLDSWLMSPARCCESFIRGVVGADLAVVVGEYERGGGCHFGTGQHTTDERASFRNVRGPCRFQGKKGSAKGLLQDRCRSVCGAPDATSFFGHLDTLCDWLSLSKLVVFRGQGYHEFLGEGPLSEKAMDGVVVVDADPEIAPLQYLLDFEVYCGLPLVGILYPRPPEKCDPIKGFSVWADEPAQLWWNDHQFQRILFRSAQRPFTIEEWPVLDYRGRITVALARDAVFGCYFPETLESLERCGARIVDFSPVKDERIPEDTDVIYLGCGQPEPYAEDLANNHCLKAAIRNHVRRGGRIYAEGAGAAYLCQWMEIQPGQFVRGVGLFPAAGRQLPRFGEPLPVTVTVARPMWLASRGTVLRGYRSPKWWFEPEPLLAPAIAEPGFEYDIIGNDRVVASVIHLDFGTHPDLLASFFAAKPESRLLPNP